MTSRFVLFAPLNCFLFFVVSTTITERAVYQKWRQRFFLHFSSGEVWQMRDHFYGLRKELSSLAWRVVPKKSAKVVQEKRNAFTLSFPLRPEGYIGNQFYMICGQILWLLVDLRPYEVMGLNFRVPRQNILPAKKKVHCWKINTFLL